MVFLLSILSFFIQRLAVSVHVCPCVKAEVVAKTLLDILEDRPVTFNNKLPSSDLKNLMLAGPTPYQVERTDEALNS